MNNANGDILKQSLKSRDINWFDSNESKKTSAAMFIWFNITLFNFIDYTDCKNLMSCFLLAKWEKNLSVNRGQHSSNSRWLTLVKSFIDWMRLSTANKFSVFTLWKVIFCKLFLWLFTREDIVYILIVFSIIVKFWKRRWVTNVALAMK